MHNSAKYIFLQQVIYLWITFIALLLLIRYKYPNSRVYHLVNVGLAILAVLQFVAIVYISVTMVF